MNNAAIDMGVNAVVKVDVPASWADAADTEAAAKSGNDFIDNILVPMNRMEGDKLLTKNAALPSTFRNGRWKNAFSATNARLYARTLLSAPC